MIRREFIRSGALAGLGISLNSCTPIQASVSHYLSFSFDDGFLKSFNRAAEIHEEYGLRGCFNVIATAHLPNFQQVGDYIIPKLMGSFKDWNRLVSKGHEVMPHTWEHLKLTEVPLSLAKNNIDKCLDYFEKNLDGYDPKKAVYNYAYNASNAELDEFLLQRVRSIRTGGWHVLEDNQIENPIPASSGPIRLGCWADGPGLCDTYIEKTVDQFLKNDGGWLIINLHGLDNEGWGPISTKYYDGLLRKLVEIKHLSVLPVGEVLKLTS